MNDILYILLTAFYVLSVLLMAHLAVLRRIFSREDARKCIHLLVSFSVFILVFCIREPWLRLVGPFSFIFINILIARKTGERLGGLVLYPFSELLLLVFMDTGFLSAVSVIAGMLVMGFGDSAAAVTGRVFGRTRFGSKSAEGSAAMYAVSFIVFLFSAESWYVSLLLASCVTVIEALSPRGWDNLTVPFSAALLMEVL